MLHDPKDGPDQVRREDADRASVSDEITLGNPYHLSRRTRTVLRIVSVVLVFSMTALFLKGFIFT